MSNKLFEIQPITNEDMAFNAILTNNSLSVGFIKCTRDNNRRQYAELTVTIVDKFHNQGLGYRLLETLTKAAMKEKITHFYGNFESSNDNMLKLLEKYRFLHNIPSDSFRLIHRTDGLLYFEMALA